MINILHFDTLTKKAEFFHIILATTSVPITIICDENNSHEITISGYKVRKITEIRNVIFGLRYGTPSSALRPKLDVHEVEYLMKSKYFWVNLA